VKASQQCAGSQVNIWFLTRRLHLLLGLVGQSVASLMTDELQRRLGGFTYSSILRMASSDTLVFLPGRRARPIVCWVGWTTAGGISTRLAFPVPLLELQVLFRIWLFRRDHPQWYAVRSWWCGAAPSPLASYSQRRCR